MDFVNQMTTKLKLAVATAVLQNKPSDLTTDQYISQLREKLTANTIDIDDGDLISSKDFDFEENTCNSDNNIDFNENLNERSADINSIDNTITQCEDNIDQSMIVTINCTENDETATIGSLQVYNVLEDTISERIETNDVTSRNDHRSPGSNSFSEVLKTLRAIDQSNINDEEHNMTNLTQDIFSKYTQIMAPHDTNCEEYMDIDDQPFTNDDKYDFIIIDEVLKAKVAKNSSRSNKICNVEDKQLNTIENMQDIDEEIPRSLINTSVNENPTPVKDFVCTKTANVAKNIEGKVTENLIESVEHKNIYNSKNFVENIPETNTSISDNLPYDTQQTILYTFHGFTEDTQISQSQCNNIEIPNKFIFGPKIGTNNNHVENMKVVKTAENNNILNKTTQKGPKLGTNNNHVENMKVVKTAENNNILNKTTQKEYSVNENRGIIMIDANQIEYITDNTGKTYAVLQSIHLNKNSQAISSNKDRSEVNNDNKIKESDKKDFLKSKAVNTNVLVNNTGDLQTQKGFNSNVLENYGTHIGLDIEMFENRTQEDFSIVNLGNDTNQNDFNAEISENDRIQNDFNTEILENRTQKGFNTGNLENYRNQNDFNTGTLGDNRTQETLNTQILENQTQKDFNIEIVDNDDGEMIVENAVPFKVVKELSNVKLYLYRERKASTDGFYSDSSGYKSDSQSSLRSAQVSEIWLHQSAYCLYNYLVQCPLVTVTQEIVAEISEVLGKLIDKLHEEEKYPNFVEELLEKINQLLKDLYEGDNSSENVLLEKDEIIQRLLLLNKSTHILRFTIDKLTGILEKTQTNMSVEDSSYELSNIGEIENLCYIFNLLEILLKKYIKVKNNYNTQSTQSSQENKVLKKSSISEIWRRKWSQNLKEIKNVGSQQKVCCLDKCGVVLNKIIVECIGGYSLISFAALQCFNLMQNQ